MKVGRNIWAFSGAGGTGKTSTAKGVLELLKNAGAKFEFLPSPSRQVFKDFGLKTEDDQKRLRPEERWQLQKAIHLAHGKLIDEVGISGQRYLADRTRVDMLCYAIQYCSEVLTEADIDWLKEKTAETCEFYRRVFYFPLVTFSGQDDGMRTDNYAKRYQFNLLLRGALQQFASRTHKLLVSRIPCLSLEARVLFVLNTINSDLDLDGFAKKN